MSSAMKLRHKLYLPALVGLALVGTACGSSSSATSSPSSTVSKSSGSSTTSTTATASASTSGSFCNDVASAKSKLLTWTTATPGSSAAAAEPLAQAFQTIANEAPAAIKTQVEDLANTFVQLEKYDNVTDPNTLLQEGPLTNGHITPDGNALYAYADAHC